MSAPPIPPVPPRPNYDSSSSYNYHAQERHQSLKPPVPPLPPNFHPDQDDQDDLNSFVSPPHFENPLVAPRPHKLQPDLPADMARTLESQVYGSAPGPGPGPVGYGGAPSGGVGGYGAPQAPAPTGAPYRATSPYAPLAYPQQQQQPLPQPHQYAQPQPQPPPPPPPQQQQYGTPPQQYGDPYRQASPYPPPPPPQQQQQNYNPGGFAFPSPSPAQAPAPGGGGGTYTPSHSHRDSLSASMAALSFSPPPSRQRTPSSAHHPSPSLSPQPQLQSSPQQQPYAQLHSSPQPQQGPPAALTAPLPTISSLAAALPSVQALPINADPSPKVAWCRDVLMLVNRVTQVNNASTGGAAGASAGAANSDPAVGPVHISDPALARLADTAVSLILQLSPLPTGTSSGTSTPQPAPPTSLPLAESLFLRATLEASGAFPHLVRQDPRTAFRDYEASARAGYHPAWFRLGRDYEMFGDETHARECFERGVRYGVESCIYRMGMANLMGQLGLPASPTVAIPLLHRAATLATVDVPQPAYVYGLLLLSEFSHVTIPPSLFTPLIPPTSTPPLEARKHLERAAFLNFAPAQYKLGHAYEFAKPPFPYDALLSVQYYSLASQQGEPEADMALSKWFLCGAEGSFEKDEALAFTFAEKAARKGLSSAEFAMGYYKEVGVGCARDVDAAKAWYEKAAANGNTDAPERLRALSQPAPQALSRQEHDTLTESKLMRKRTQAQKLSDAQAYPRVNPGRAGMDASQVVEVIRRNSRLERPSSGADRRRISGGAGGGALTPAQQLQAQYQQQHQQQQQPQPPLQPTQPLRVGGGAAHLEHSSTLQHAPPQQRPATHRHGYSLSDTPAPFPGAVGGGPGPGPGPGGRANSPGRPARGRGRGGHGHSPSATPNPYQAGLASPQPPPLASPPIGSGPPKDGFGVGAGGVGAPGMDKYQTFAEMGFQSQKLEEKDCVIM